MKHPSKHLSLSKDFQPNPSPDTPSGGTEVDAEKMRQAQIRLRDIIFGSSGQDASNKDEDDEPEKMGNRPATGMFLNISLKKFYQTLSELCTDSVSPPGAKHYKENYEKIYSYIQSVVPDADSMTICSFLRYIDDAYMYPRCYKGESEEEYKERIRQGNRLSELFFLYSFSPLLRRRGLHYEAVTFRLTSTYVNRQTKRKE